MGKLKSTKCPKCGSNGFMFCQEDEGIPESWGCTEGCGIELSQDEVKLCIACGSGAEEGEYYCPVCLAIEHWQNS